MKKLIILIPVFNDWESLEKLIIEINENIKEFQKIHIECLVVNDASTIKQPILFRYIPKGAGETLNDADPEEILLLVFSTKNFTV